MKKILLVIAVLGLLCGCSKEATPETKARALIKNYIDSNLGDPKSYEAIVFTDLDSTFHSPARDEAYKRFEKLYDSLSLVRDMMSEIGQYNRSSEISDQILTLFDKYEAEVDTLPDEHLGYGMGHKFRFANIFGGKEVAILYFDFDKDVTMVNAIDTLTREEAAEARQELQKFKEENPILTEEEQRMVRRAENILKLLDY